MLDLIPLVTIIMCVVFGAYRGFVITSIKGGIFLLSAVMAFFMYPIFTAIFGGYELLDLAISYTEGSDYINSVDNINLPNEDISQYSDEQLDDIANKSTLPIPYRERVKQTMKEAKYEQYGVSTVSDYFDLTVAIVTINICSYLITFIILRIIFGFILNMIDYARPFPVLKRNDAMFGGLIGFVCGFFICYVVFAITPVVLTLANVNFITSYIMESDAVKYFYTSNFIITRIRPVL